MNEYNNAIEIMLVSIRYVVENDALYSKSISCGAKIISGVKIPIIVPMNPRIQIIVIGNGLLVFFIDL